MKDKIKFLVNKINELPIATKIFMSFLFFTIIPLTIIILILFNNVEVSVKNKMEYSASQAFEQAESILTSKTKYINNILNLLYLNDSMQRISNNTNEKYLSDYGRQLVDGVRLRKFVYSFEKSDEVDKFTWYVPARSIFANNNVTYFNIDSITNTEWYKMLMQDKNSTLWLSAKHFEDEDAEEIIPVLRIIKDLNNLSSQGSIVRLDLSHKNIAAILENAKITKSTLVMLCDSNFNLICSTDDETALEQLNFIPANIAAADLDDWDYYNLNNDTHYLKLVPIEDTDWQLVMSIPNSDILSEYTQLPITAFLILILCLVVVYITAYFIARINTSRLNEFTKVIKRAEAGDFSIRFEPIYKDEIGILAGRFNSLLSRLSSLMDEKYKLGQRVKSTELKLLQSQINPHFLYNTLDLINWFSIMGKDEDLRDVVESLARFYKLSLNRGQEEISVSEELDHVKAYVAIQNKRFSERVKLVIDVNDKIRQIRILSIILQPIVENSIFHGIIQDEKSAGTIWIRGFTENDQIKLVVEDNGTGMNPSKIEDIFKSGDSSKDASYGLKNIKERLDNYYGITDSLQIFSDPGSGTTVTIRIPVQGNNL